MRKRTPKGARESTLASGWTVEGDAPELAPPLPVEAGFGDAERGSRDGDAVELTTERFAGQESAAGVSSETSLSEATDVGNLSNTAIVLLGAFGGLYLLYSWGWFIVAQAYSAVNSSTAAGSGVVGGVLQQIIFWAAPVAPMAWLITAILLTRGRGAGRLALALVVGALVLVPLPMLVSGVVA